MTRKITLPRCSWLASPAFVLLAPSTERKWREADRDRSRRTSQRTGTGTWWWWTALKQATIRHNAAIQHVTSTWRWTRNGNVNGADIVEQQKQRYAPGDAIYLWRIKNKTTSRVFFFSYLQALPGSQNKNTSNKSTYFCIKQPFTTATIIEVTSYKYTTHTCWWVTTYCLYDCILILN